MSLEDEPTILACIPAYNEANTIADIVNKTKKYASEVVVYDDGSVDKTDEIAKAAGATVIRDPKNKGYGAAIKTLFRVAKAKNADIMVTLDSDGQHNPNDIPAIIEPILTEGFDIVIGSRFLDDKDKMQIPAYRRLGIRTITRFTSRESYRNMTDAQSGFRAYSKKAISKINLFDNGMSASTEILLRAKESSLLMKEVPVTITYQVENPSTHHALSHGLGVLFRVLQFITLRHPLTFYGIAGIVMLVISAFYTNGALDWYSKTKFISTNMILLSVGSAVVGMILLSTAVILFGIISLIKDKIRE
jgi:glycosyltransferase involved in cell wall biosynthesis